MLSVEQCKNYLPGYSDDKVEEVRDSLYQLAGIAIDNYSKSRSTRQRPSAEDLNRERMF